MAKLMGCRACEAEISQNAKSCPHCGEPTKKRTSAVKGVLGLLVILAIIGSFSNHTNKGSDHIFRAQQIVKGTLKDADSANFSDAVYTRSGAVCGKVNSKNGFGAYTGYKEFIVMAGSPMMREQVKDDEFVKTWNRLCAK